jgi:hypothetical protein
MQLVHEIFLLVCELLSVVCSSAFYIDYKITSSISSGPTYLRHCTSAGVFPSIAK